MSKVTITTLCMISILLLHTLTCASARLAPAFHDVTPIETPHMKDEEVAKNNEAEENCKGAGDEEDCLMRRTMVAHLDYIYTQKKQP